MEEERVRYGIDSENKRGNKVIEYSVKGEHKSSATLKFTTNKTVYLEFTFCDNCSIFIELSKDGYHSEGISGSCTCIKKDVLDSLDEFMKVDCNKFVDEILNGRVFIDKRIINEYLKDGIMKVLQTYEEGESKKKFVRDTRIDPLYNDMANPNIKAARGKYKGDPLYDDMKVLG